MRRILVGFAFLFSIASATVHYKLTPEPSAKSILVSLTIDNPKATETFRIPGWCPGYYQMATYQKKLFDVKVADNHGRILSTDSADSRTWKAYGGGSKQITMSYRVLGDDPGLGFFAVNVASDKVFINGAAAFMYVDGRTTEDIDLTIQNPTCWDVATPMTPGQDAKFVATGYDEFIDHPIQLGAFKRKTFTVSGIPFEVIFVAPENDPRCDLDAETERLRLVSKPALDLFKGAAFKKYFYIIHLEVGNFSGGLEHRACNVQAVSNTGELHLDDLAAHEYFHAWNVKQIRPKILGPFDYTQPQRTANLWFSEGVTDYYAKLHTYQSGLKTEDWLRNELADQIRQLQGGQTRKVKTVEEASRGCWEQDGFSVGDLSFYTKGLLAGFLFDAAIIDATNGTKTLDDVMRTLFQKCQIPKPGFGEDELRTTINEVAGKDLSELYNKIIRSTDEMPYSTVSKIGIKIALPSQDRQSPISDGTAEYAVEVDRSATPQAKAFYNVWLHRLNSVQ
jgi:predicted metalloprotease with PDZ domain